MTEVSAATGYAFRAAHAAPAPGRLGPLIGASKAMRVLYDSIMKVGPTGASILIHGESGTGKELVAEIAHRLSPRRAHPFVAVNCGAISPHLMESELFGHERGSFTGADRTHRGFFEQAAGGTLFLDEVAEMPQELQAKLLRVLETNRVMRVGAEGEVGIDVRIIAATNREPQRAVDEGTLREDLLYRLAVFPLPVPPLRERAGDVPVLAEHFLTRLNRAEGTDKHFAPNVFRSLESRVWAGNVRELRNVVERAFILADGEIDANCFAVEKPRSGAGELRSAAAATATAEGRTVQVAVGTSLREAERRLIIATLEAFRGNKERAAGQLGISLKTLYNRIKSYGYDGPGRVRPRDCEVGLRAGAGA